MVYIKVTNLMLNGQADYKGLELSKIVPGTQLYPQNENYCIVGYDGEIPVNADLAEVTEADHTALKTQMENNRPISDSERLSLLEDALNNMILGGA